MKIRPTNRRKTRRKGEEKERALGHGGDGGGKEWRKGCRGGMGEGLGVRERGKVVRGEGKGLGKQ